MRRREGSPKAELERRTLPLLERLPTQKTDPPVLTTPSQKGRSPADPKELLGGERGRIEDASPEDPGIEMPHPPEDSPPTGRRRGESEERVGEPGKESPTRYPKGVEKLSLPPSERMRSPLCCPFAKGERGNPMEEENREGR